MSVNVPKWYYYNTWNICGCNWMYVVWLPRFATLRRTETQQVEDEVSKQQHPSENSWNMSELEQSTQCIWDSVWALLARRSCASLADGIGLRRQVFEQAQATFVPCPQVNKWPMFGLQIETLHCNSLQFTAPIQTETHKLQGHFEVSQRAIAC